MVVADLHAHTTNSDGTFTLETLVAAARARDLAAVAVTDHDRTHPGLDAPVVDRDGLTVVHGVELRVAPGGERVDLLGYGVEETPALRAELDRVQRDRIERGRAIVERLEDRLGVDLDVAFERGLGRPDIARAAADHPDTELTHDEVFDRYIGSDGPCYVAREVPSFERGRELLVEACAVVGLAHPLRYDDPAAALALTAELDAVEGPYPYEGPVDRAPVEAAAAEHDLLVTGGSDAHDETLGRAGLDAEGWAAVRSALAA